MTATLATPSPITPVAQVTIDMPQAAPAITTKAKFVAQVMSFNPFKPLSGRISHTPSDLLMIGGIITSVVFAVSTFFAGATLYSCGFAFLGMVSLFGAYCVRKYPTLIQLQGMVTSLENTNRDLQTTNRELQETRQHLEVIAGNLSHQNTVLQETSRDLAQTNIDLRETNERFEATQRAMAQTNTDLRATNAQLTTQVGALSTQVGQLTTQVTQLEGALRRIMENVDQFSQHNLAFRGSLERLEGRNAALDASIQTLGQRFEGGFSSLVEVTRALETQISANRTFAQEVNTRLAEVLSDQLFRDRLAALPMVNQQIITAQAQLTATTERLTALEGRCRETEGALNRGLEQLGTVNTQLQETQGRLATGTQRLLAIESRITAQVGRMDGAIDRLEAVAPPTPTHAVAGAPGVPLVMRAGLGAPERAFEVLGGAVPVRALVDPDTL